MARLARKKVPAATIVVGDISRITLKRHFDVIVCAFDTINHISDFSRWKEVFARAHEQLEERGVFIFDINTEAKIDRYHEEPPYIEVNEEGVSVFDVTRTGGSKYTLSVKVFKHHRKNSYRLHEMEVKGATFPVSRIRTELLRYFHEVSLLDLERARPSDKSEELYFICKGPR
jgi:SAM-dependent methyltransferase